MKHLWNFIENKNWKAETKYRILLLICCLTAAAAGFLCWIPVRILITDTLDWMFCCITYPAMMTWLAVILYSYRHDFHDGI